MNNQIPPFDNINVRRAIAYALPYDDMFKAAMFGRGTPLFGAIWADGKPTSGAYPFQQPVKLDLDKAKEYLKAAGMPDGFSTTFSFNVGQASTAEPMSALVKESLAKIGIKVDIQKLPDAQMSTQINEKKLPFFTEGIVAWLPSTDYFYRNFYTGEQRWNYSSIKNAELTAIAQQARFEADKAKYDEYGKKLNAIHFAEMPQIPLWQPNQDAVMATSIDGYTYQFHRQVDYRDLHRK
jgi:peptide/nickel transport system substrate-binding protein